MLGTMAVPSHAQDSHNIKNCTGTLVTLTSNKKADKSSMSTHEVVDTGFEAFSVLEQDLLIHETFL